MITISPFDVGTIIGEALLTMPLLDDVVEPERDLVREAGVTEETLLTERLILLVAAAQFAIRRRFGDGVEAAQLLAGLFERLKERRPAQFDALWSARGDTFAAYAESAELDANLPPDEQISFSEVEATFADRLLGGRPETPKLMRACGLLAINTARALWTTQVDATDSSLRRGNLVTVQ